MTRPVVIVGAGGHAAVVADTLLAAGRSIVGLTDAAASLRGTWVFGLPVLGDDGILADYPPTTVELAIGIGSVRVSPLRRRLFEHLKSAGYRFATVVHPAAVLGREVVIGEGCQVMAGAVVQTRARLGVNAVVNTQATIDHDCRIGDHAQIGPAATLCGNVVVGDDSFIGAGATVIQDVRIGAGTQVGAGAVVLRDCADGSRIVGIPAKELQR